MNLTAGERHLVVADPALTGLAQNIARTSERFSCVLRAYAAALADGQLTAEERHGLALELQVLISEAQLFQHALDRVCAC